MLEARRCQQPITGRRGGDVKQHGQSQRRQVEIPHLPVVPEHYNQTKQETQHIKDSLCRNEVETEVQMLCRTQTGHSNAKTKGKCENGSNNWK